MIRLLTCVALLALVGCARFSCDGSGSDGGAAGAGSDLASLGRVLLWTGGICAVLGLAVWASFRVGRLSPIGAIIGAIPFIGPIAKGLGIFIAEAGGIAIGIGVVAIEVGNHMWIFWASCGVAAVAWAWHRRRNLRRWLGLGPASDAPAKSLTPHQSKESSHDH